eukprot:TRINITY_DN11507_c0_g1_i1.p1 TRINITY_DN11507_c0_g1~~TRINITY_DN11507_c0_g1_i1.p1  ORF type:complete len:425 (-),score=101.71 TRINITY_DN11507_c0_g1_i1:48-1322(-)
MFFSKTVLFCLAALVLVLTALAASPESSQLLIVTQEDNAVTNLDLFQDYQGILTSAQEANASAAQKLVAALAAQLAAKNAKNDADLLYSTVSAKYQLSKIELEKREKLLQTAEADLAAASANLVAQKPGLSLIINGGNAAITFATSQAVTTIQTATCSADSQCNNGDFNHFLVPMCGANARGFACVNSQCACAATFRLTDFMVSKLNELLVFYHDAPVGIVSILDARRTVASLYMTVAQNQVAVTEASSDLNTLQQTVEVKASKRDTASSAVQEQRGEFVVLASELATATASQECADSAFAQTSAQRDSAQTEADAVAAAFAAAKLKYEPKRDQAKSRADEAFVRGRETALDTECSEVPSVCEGASYDYFASYWCNQHPHFGCGSSGRCVFDPACGLSSTASSRDARGWQNALVTRAHKRFLSR